MTALVAMGLFAVACSKSSKSKETSSSQTKLNGDKTDKNKPGDPPANPDNKDGKSVHKVDDTNKTKGPNTTTNDTAPPPTALKNHKGAGKGGFKLLANKPEYTLKLVYPSNLANGASGTARLLIKTKAGWKLNNDYPTKLRIMSPEGTQISKAKMERTDAVRWAEHGAEFQVKITANGTGAKPFTGKFKFAVCTKNTCDPKKELLAWVVNVK